MVTVSLDPFSPRTACSRLSTSDSIRAASPGLVVISAPFHFFKLCCLDGTVPFRFRVAAPTLRKGLVVPEDSMHDCAELEDF